MPDATPTERDTHAPQTPQAPQTPKAPPVPQASSAPPQPAAAPRPSSPSSSPPSLLPSDERDKLAARLEHAVVGFVDGPRDAVEEADHVLEALTARLTEAVQTRRRDLRGSLKPPGTGGTGTEAGTGADTEQLRLALRDYRELTQRLLHM